jgi:hypothetical protein
MAGKNPVVDDDMPAGAVSPDDETVNFGAGVDDNESLDLSGVNENQPMKLIPNGPYPATVVHAEWKKSNSGNKMYEVRFRMQDPDDGKNRTLFFHATATPDTMSRLKKFLKTVAPDIDWDQPFNPAERAAVLVMDDEGNPRRARITVGTETYNNNLRNRITKVEPAGDADFFTTTED